MALPKLEVSTYTLELPSTSEKIKYRPFLVKEQKLLMMAQESRDEKQISEMIQQLIGANSLRYLQLDSILNVMQNNTKLNFCTSCFDGTYNKELEW